MEAPNCPKCGSTFSYQDQHLWICPECAHEWIMNSSAEEVLTTEKFIDASGNALINGDTVKTIKELKLGKSTLKPGTKIKNIRLLDEPVNGHDISCKVDGLGQIYLKCSVVRKS